MSEHNVVIIESEGELIAVPLCPKAEGEREEEPAPAPPPVRELVIQHTATCRRVGEFW